MFRFVLNRSITAALVLLVAVTGCTAAHPPARPVRLRPVARRRPRRRLSQPASAAAPVLKSPFSYDGAAGPYSQRHSRTAHLRERRHRTSRTRPPA